MQTGIITPMNSPWFNPSIIPKNIIMVFSLSHLFPTGEEPDQWSYPFRKLNSGSEPILHGLLDDPDNKEAELLPAVAIFS